MDGVFYFEGDRFQSFRLLRGVKNRFGSTNEIGIFEMETDGLTEVTNPSEIFMAQEGATREGCVVTPSLIGSRTLLVEIQALTTPSPRPEMVSRRVSGLDRDRMMLILAVLSRRYGISTANDDVILNAVGGVRIDEPAADLAMALALASSVVDRPITERTLAFGEVGLTGEVRGVPQSAARLTEAKRLGFTRAIVPKASMKSIGEIKGLQIIPVSELGQAFLEAKLQ